MVSAKYNVFDEKMFDCYFEELAKSQHESDGNTQTLKAGDAPAEHGGKKKKSKKKKQKWKRVNLQLLGAEPDISIDHTLKQVIGIGTTAEPESVERATEDSPSGISVIRNWLSESCLSLTKYEQEYITKHIKKKGWDKRNFYSYFKNAENDLLIFLKNSINKLDALADLPEWWYVFMEAQWRMVAVFRDFHDSMCGRDEKHHIRTDDCRRFVSGIKSGIKTGEFPKPVHRILRGNISNKPTDKFTHPNFVQFNEKHC